MGDLDFKDVKHPNMITYISKNEELVKLTLMQADLEFEYPMKLEKMIVKSDILKLANKEEEKLVFDEQAEILSREAKKTMTYEEYFQMDPLKDGHKIK